MCYYYIPEHLLDYYRKNCRRDKNITVPILKRRFQAMMEASRYTRKHFIKDDKCLCKYNFNGFNIVVSHNNCKIYDIFWDNQNHTSNRTDKNMIKEYRRICMEKYRLNKTLNDFIN